MDRTECTTIIDSFGKRKSAACINPAHSLLIYVGVREFAWRSSIATGDYFMQTTTTKSIART